MRVRLPLSHFGNLSVLALTVHLLGTGCSENRTRDVDAPPDASPLFDLSQRRYPDLSSPWDMARPPVHVVMTADNAYAFGWGDSAHVTKLNGRPITQVAGDIFNCPIGIGPEEYDIPAQEAPEDLYLYVVAWADDATTQGLIGQFDRGGLPTYTGSGPWEACATGLSYPTGLGGFGPPIEVVNREIERCNAGGGDTSKTSAGWVNSAGAITPGSVGSLAVGEDNSDSTGDFPIVCQKDLAGKRGVDSAARWMWYSPDGKSPFRYQGGVNPTRTFLLFRLPGKVIVIG